jgi:hypothetical protein
MYSLDVISRFCSLHKKAFFQPSFFQSSTNQKMEGVPFYNNFDCESALKWPKLVDQLEDGMMRYSTGGIVMPVRAMLPVRDHNGYLGNDTFSGHAEVCF